MKSQHVFTAVFVLGVAGFSACGGKLHVGQEKREPTAGEGGDATDGSGGSSAGSGGSSGGVGGAKSSGGSAGTPAAGGSGFAGSGGSASAGAGSGGTSSNTSGASGTGGTSEPGSGGSAGTTTEPELDPVPPIEGSSEGCPDGPGLHEKECDTQGMTCGYSSDGTGAYHYSECGCARTETGLEWNCYQNFGGDRVCPPSAPEDGSDCFGFYATECYYPIQLNCRCSAETGVWECMSPPPPTDFHPPEFAVGDRSIAELSDAEREEWCTWYASLSVSPGFPPTPDYAVNADGFVDTSGCRFSVLPPCQASMPIVSVAQCKANLEVTACPAPVSALTACITNSFNECDPLGDGCVDLYAAGCSGTISSKVLSRLGTPPCSLRVQ